MTGAVEMKTKVIKIISFSIIVAVLMCMAERTLIYKDTGGGAGWQRFYRQDPEPDVLFFGSSHCHCTVDQPQLWNDYGIAGYTLTGGGQFLDGTYYMMKEAFRVYHPKAAAVELFMLANDDPDYSDFAAYKVSMGMKQSDVRKEYLQYIRKGGNIPGTHYFELLTKFPIVHSRYAELTRDDYIDTMPWFKGYYGSFDQGPENKPDIGGIKDAASYSDFDAEYMDKIVRLCREDDVPLYFWIAPYSVDAESQKKYNYAQEYAAQHDIPFVNFNSITGQIGFDYSTDLRGDDHVNNSGAAKVTAYLAQWIKGTTALEDHRGDKRYHSWDLNAEYFSGVVLAHQLENAKYATDYCAALQNRPELTVVVSLCGDYKKDYWQKEFQGAAGLLGIDNATYEAGGTWVKQNGSFTFYQGAGRPFRLDLTSQGVDASVCLNDGGITEMYWQGVDEVKAADGVNFMVFDTATGELINARGFGTLKETAGK